MIDRKLSLKHKTFCVNIVLLFFSAFCYSQNSSDYERFVDSASVYIDYESKKAMAFLDSIPEPIDDYIKKGLPNYYNFKSLFYDEKNDNLKSYQNSTLALKHAVELEDYEIAGHASLALFSNVYAVKKDTATHRYLEKARTYYKLSNYTHGDLEVDLAYAYAKFIDKDYKTCNAFLLDNMHKYKAAKDDAYFYMFALSILTFNYLDLDDLETAYTRFNDFKKLKNDSTIVSYNYMAFESSINVSFAEAYYKKKQLDSTFHYLKESSGNRHYMTKDVEEDYLKLYVGAYSTSNNDEMAKAYTDSLMIFEEKKYEDIMSTSFQINNDLVETEMKLEDVNSKQYVNGVLVFVLLILLTASSFVYMFFYRKQKFKTANLSNETSNLSYIKANNKKLVVKVQGLEDYIHNLKSEIKKISTIGEVSTQRKKIKELYKTIHLNSSTILDKSENHLDLVNDLNVDFFQRINKMYPQLNNSEIIICYYLYVGFKNKEIAVFLNTSVRAIESKRYRITKKINLNKEMGTLLEHLTTTFSNLEKLPN
ncbi:helix-turn-helix transcriptional regulator [Flavivirga algicola]|uniref:HTH luxR-type domain-containing protein n=1 Tax=Flavivirga algicola TaxID=2729136 RepID=A0ABX1RSR0_9FLAO|nr:hypothetical protein [Flavivirga algicola]NMH86108.1 hypothetical protein [Flavivirga algicola]